MSLYNDLKKLAAERPETRSLLVPFLREARGTNFAGVNTTPFETRMQAVVRDWWVDVEKVITEWWSFSKNTVKRGPYQLIITIHDTKEPFTITVKGTPRKFKVSLYNQDKEFGPSANLEKDMVYWLDSVKQSRW